MLSTASAPTASSRAVAQHARRGLARRFSRDAAGATAIEYALIASVLFVALAAVLPFVATELQGTFQVVVAGFQQ